MAYKGRPQNVVRRIEPWPEGWQEPIDLFLNYLEAKRLSERTIDGYVTTHRRLALDVQCPPEKVTRAQLLRRQSRPSIVASTAATERIHYRSGFGFWLDEGIITTNPAAKLPKVKVRKGSPRPVTREQLAALFTAGPRGAYATTQDLLILAAYAGLRSAESARMRGEMIDFEENTIRYIAKGGYEHVQPMHPLVRAVAERMPRRGWWFPSPNGTGPILAKSVSTRIGVRIRAAGIDDPRITGHSLRHFFGTELSRSGADITLVQSLMGHASIASTMIYVQVDQTRKNDALAGLPYVDAPIVNALATSANLPRLADRRREKMTTPGTENEAANV